MAQKQASKQNEKLYSENVILKLELEKVRVQSNIHLNAETNRAEKNRAIANHNAEVASKLREDLTIERIGRRSLHESLRRERMELVAQLYVIDQRLRVLAETSRGDDQALDQVTGQVETEHGDAVYHPREL